MLLSSLFGLNTATPRSKRLWIEAGLIFAFWTAVAVLMIGSRVLDRPGARLDGELIAYFFLQSYLWALITPLIFTAARRFSIDKLSQYRTVLLHIGLAIFVSLFVEFLDKVAVVHIVQPRWADRVSLNPITSPIDSLLELSFLYELTIYLAVLAAGFARNYFLRFEERRKQAIELQNQLTQARLNALRMQINPHFLFNTLHAISSLVERDPQGVRNMVARLSNLLRYTLDESDTQEVPLRQEMEVLDAYLDIQRIRFQGQLEIEEDMAPETEEALVPPLILQPLVENAIKHGISNLKGMGHITVRAYRDGDDLFLAVADNGPGLPDNGAALEKGVGLQNTEARLHEMYGEEADLFLGDSDAGGLLARIRLPFHTTEKFQTMPQTS